MSNRCQHKLQRRARRYIEPEEGVNNTTCELVSQDFNLDATRPRRHGAARLTSLCYPRPSLASKLRDSHMPLSNGKTSTHTNARWGLQACTWTPPARRGDAHLEGLLGPEIHPVVLL